MQLVARGIVEVTTQDPAIRGAHMKSEIKGLI